MTKQDTRLDWDDAQRRAKELVSRLTNEEKATLCTGTGWKKGPALGNIAAVPSIDFPGLALQDGPNGLRWIDRGSAPPCQLNAAATFNKDLMRRRGELIGAEARGKGINVALAPCMNMMRAPAGGRNFESSGSDPYLQGEVAYETVMGIQSKGVQATAKHFIANEQEHFRQSSSSNMGDSLLHTIYLHPFLRSVQADVASIMTSYNQLNETYASQHCRLLHDIMNTELGFKGFIQSDWWAQKEDIPSAIGGLDMTMPGEPAFGDWDNTFFGPHLVEAVKNGPLSQERLDAMATRVLTSWLALKQDQGFPKTNFWCWDLSDDSKNEHVDVAGKDHGALIREVGEASTVLLKNDDGILPLKGSGKLRALAVIGQHAGDSRDGPSLSGEGGPGWDDYVEQSISGGIPVDENDPLGSTGCVAMGWGSGTSQFPYLISPLNAIQRECIDQRIACDWALDNASLKVAQLKAKRAQVAVVCVGSPSGEEFINVKGCRGDRNHLQAWHDGDKLVNAVAEVNPNVIVVVYAGGPILMESWIDKVKAVVWAGMPGQEAGNSLASILFGQVNPSGRLPFTVAKKREDYGADVIYEERPPITPIDYTEGELFDYRRMLKANIQPRFAFGHGLSYTAFEYSNLDIKQLSAPPQDEVVPTSADGSSVAPALHKDVVEVSCQITNTGSREGTEIPQLYVAFPEGTSPSPRVLRGFEALSLKPRESKNVSFGLSSYALSVWNEDKQRWIRPDGKFTALVGASCEKIHLQGDF